ncbi:MAG TPA: FlgD immunoglobulin-like domain containing protein [bacterium]|nr:FlgD immunoglobulin-like domain containing protein [bacterium]
MRLKSALAVLVLCLAPALARAYVTVASSQILALADDGLADDTGFWATVLTPPYPGGQNILYGPNALTFTGTSHLVFDLNGTPVDMQTDEPVAVPVTASTGPGPDGLGDSISMARSLGSLEYGARYTIVVDPHSGAGADSVQIQAWVSDSAAGLPASVGLRVLLDSMVGGNDGSPLSDNDGVSVYGAVTLFQAAVEGVPSDWWSYNQYPSPTLAARGVTWGNQFGTPATPPDAVEFCQWSDVYSMGFWGTDPNPGVAFSDFSNPPYNYYPDTAVALWYTNTGQAGYMDASNVAQGDGYSVAPGQTLVFTTYVGLNQSPLGASPTPFISATFTPSVSSTQTPSLTWSATGTVSDTFTPSPSWTASSTYTVTPTISPSFSASPSFSVSPSFSASPTASPSFTVTPSFSVSPSASPSPSATPSFSVSPTFSVSPSATPSFSASPSASPSFKPTASATPALTPTPPATATPAPGLELSARDPNPDPSPGQLWLPYVLTCDADVDIRIYDVAGETVRDLAPFAGQAGANEEYWDGLNSSGQAVASGVYIAHISAQAFGARKAAWVKMAIVR